MRRRQALTPIRTARRNIPALLPMLRRGAVDPDDFFRLTAADFLRLAAHVMRPFRGIRALPADVEEADVANRLRLFVLQAIPGWDPTRGATLGDYCVYRACSRAGKWLNQRRGAKKAQAGSSPSRCPLLLADVVGGDSGDGGDDADHDRIVRFVERRTARFGDGEQHDAVAASDLLAHLRQAGVAAGENVDDALAALAISPALRRAARAALEGYESWQA